MKKILRTLGLFCLLTTFNCVACSSDDIPAEIIDEEEEKPSPSDPNDPDTPPDKIEYDDGTYLKFNVKIAIDKEALDYKGGDLDWFKNNLRVQWRDINNRFNALDKKGQLKRIYRFYPDLDDIWIYSREDCPVAEDGTRDMNDFHWRIPDYFDKAGKLDKHKFQCCVVYDFMAQEGEGGGGCGDYEGIANILVIHPTSEGAGDKFTNHFLDEKNGTTSITHELGHFRGIIDTYTHSITAASNPVSHTAFTPAYGNMNNPYGPTEDETSLWNDYEIKVLNAVGAKKEFRLIYTTMRDYFADQIKINAVRDGKLLQEGMTINFYNATGHKVDPNILADRTVRSADASATVDAYKLFWHNDKELYPWTYYDMFLVEVLTEGNRKGYAWLPNYFVHEQGLTDKTDPEHTGLSVYELNVEIR